MYFWKKCRQLGEWDLMALGGNKCAINLKNRLCNLQPPSLVNRLMFQPAGMYAFCRMVPWSPGPPSQPHFTKARRNKSNNLNSLKFQFPRFYHSAKRKCKWPTQIAFESHQNHPLNPPETLKIIHHPRKMR